MVKGKEVRMRIGRYFEDKILDFFSAYHNVAKKSRIETYSERRRILLSSDMARVSGAGLGPREHGCTCYESGSREFENMIVFEKREKMEQEAEFLNEYRELLRVHLSEVELRLSEIDTNRGTPEFRKRQREFEVATNNIANRGIA